MVSDIKRRDFIKLSSAGLVASAGVAAGSGAAGAMVECTTPAAASTIVLTITKTTVEMVDGVMVPMLAYQRGTAVSRVPGPVVRVREGEEVSITITNSRPERHGFEITGIPGAAMTIEPGQTCRVTFTAPVAGTYLYHDPSHPSRHLYRILGLHGAFIVHPAANNGWSIDDAGKRCITPYSLNQLAPGDVDSGKNVSKVFEAFGTSPRFPGGKWVPCPIDQEFSIQEKIWLFNEVDPRFNALIRDNGINSSGFVADSDTLRANFVPRYFTINGRSGYDLSQGEDVVVKNYIGEPTLIRTLNAGMNHHAAHIHGNHLFELAHSILTNDGFIPFMGSSRVGAPGEVVLHNNIWERDVWPTWPMQIRDMLLPMEVPPDIPNWAAHASGAAAEKFPLRYVMHDHCEMGTTAAGGNYPQGAVTHWEILGPVGARAPA